MNANNPPLPKGRGDSPTGERGRDIQPSTSEHPHPLAAASRLPHKGAGIWKIALVHPYKKL